MSDTPFGASFGNPSRYMGSSGIGPAIKTGLTAYGMQKSGLTDWLNNLNKKPEQQTVVQGAVPLPAPAQSQQMPVVPPAAGAPDAAPVAPVPPMVTETPATPVIQAPVQQNPQELGLDWLNGKMSNFVNPQASRDIPVAQGGGYTEQLGSGTDYQKVPGYGKLAKFMQSMGGMA